MAPRRGSSLAERVAESLSAPASADPADLDGLDDETTAGRRRTFDDAALKPVSLGPPEKRLRMRAGIPELSKYKGKKVDRREIFGQSEDEDDLGGSIDGEDGAEPFPLAGPSDDDADEEAGALGHSGETSAGNFSISGKLEAEYDKMMKQTSKQLEIMRAPSASEVAKRQDEAKRLKRQLEAWNSLVEFRIHLEGAMSLGHRLPVGDVVQGFREVSPTAASEGDRVAEELRGLLGELLALQGRVADSEMLRRDLADARSAPSSGSGEARAWAAVNAALQPVLDWSLEEADAWKERTRLDTRKGFKVLDQSFRMQMQAVSEVPQEKLRKRCTPPPGRHKVFGIARKSSGAAEAEESKDGGEEDIFDDREFYVQLLREVLGGGGGSSGKAGLSDEAKEMQLELQGRRATKRKARADVERRASKGRKIRYVPIEKLQNFMAPRPRDAAGAAGSLLAGEAASGTVPLQEGAMEALLRSLFA